jgi:hypothetical protein
MLSAVYGRPSSVTRNARSPVALAASVASNSFGIGMVAVTGALFLPLRFEPLTGVKVRRCPARAGGQAARRQTVSPR